MIDYEKKKQQRWEVVSLGSAHKYGNGPERKKYDLFELPKKQAGWQQYRKMGKLQKYMYGKSPINHLKLKLFLKNAKTINIYTKIVDLETIHFIC